MLIFKNGAWQTGCINRIPPPIITAQPQAATICYQSSHTLQVTAAGIGLNYVWRKNGVPVVNGSTISGQGTNRLAFSSPMSGDTGNFDVIVSTAGGSVTSTAIYFSVRPESTYISRPCANPPIGGTTLTLTLTGFSHTIDDTQFRDLVSGWSVGTYGPTHNAGQNWSMIRINFNHRSRDVNYCWGLWTWTWLQCYK